MSGASSPATMAEKVWRRHVVRSGEGEPDLLYIDLHLVHEVTSPQAFDGLRLAGRSVRRPDLTVATMDHNVPTTALDQPLADPISARQIEVLAENCAQYGIRLFPMGDANQGIVHIIGPELGLTQPGMVIVCGDSHTSTHGAFGALAFGIGTSEVEHVLAAQTLPQAAPKTMAVTVEGDLPAGVTAKDIVLAIIGRIGTGGGIGHVIEYRGSAIRSLSMEGRMTVCNMSIEAGARAGMVAPDDTTFSYIDGRKYAPKGKEWETALESWRSLVSDPDAQFDKEVHLDAALLAPHVTWGTNPGQVVRLDEPVPDPDTFPEPDTRESGQRGSSLYGPGGRDTYPRDQGRHRLYRVVYKCPDRGPASCRLGTGRAYGCAWFTGTSGTRFGPSKDSGRKRRPGQNIYERRVRMAQPGVLHVLGDEPRQACAR